MLGSFFRRLATSPVAKLPTLTVYHNTLSTTSTHLVNKLCAYAALPSTAQRYAETPRLAGGVPKFVVQVKENQLPSFEDYEFVHEKCLGIHPGNMATFRRLFPRLAGSLRYAGDLQMMSATEYDAVLLANRSRFFKPPLVIDHTNCLVAHDDQGLDRIMANYLSCGTQDSHKNIAGEDDSKFQHMPHVSANASQEMRTHHIHPHIAEFADLY